MAHTASTDSTAATATTTAVPPAPAVPPTAESPLHEGSTISLRMLIIVVVVFVGVAVAIHVGIYWAFAGFRAAAAQPREITGVSSERIPPPEPRLQPSVENNELPSMDLDRVRAAEHEEFAKRGWVDPETGQVRVPEKIVNQLAQMSRAKK